jgi:hypothetical protein
MNVKWRQVGLKSSAAFRDLIVIISIAIPLFAAASIFHAFERFAEFHQKYGVGPIDDFIIAFALMAIALALFCIRRWREVQKSLARIVTLQGLIPICASCNKVRDDVGYWNRVEFYIESHSQAELYHTICPKCLKKLYGGSPPDEDLDAPIMETLST